MKWLVFRSCPVIANVILLSRRESGRLKPQQYSIAHLLLLIIVAALAASTLAAGAKGPTSSFFIFSWIAICIVAAIAAQWSNRRPHYWGACAGAAWPLFFVLATVILHPMREIYGPDEMEFAYTFTFVFAAISGAFGSACGAIIGWTVKLSIELRE